MNRIDILIAVDVNGALATSSLETNVYLVDTNKYLGSWNQGQSALQTVCQDGQELTWSVTSVDPGAQVSIAAFAGDMVSQKICQPMTDPLSGNGAWSALVESQGQFASFAYSVTLNLQGQQMAFAAAIKVV